MSAASRLQVGRVSRTARPSREEADSPEPERQIDELIGNCFFSHRTPSCRSGRDAVSSVFHIEGFQKSHSAQSLGDGSLYSRCYLHMFAGFGGHPASALTDAKRRILHPTQLWALAWRLDH